MSRFAYLSITLVFFLRFFENGTMASVHTEQDLSEVMPSIKHVRSGTEQEAPIGWWEAFVKLPVPTNNSCFMCRSVLFPLKYILKSSILDEACVIIESLGQDLSEVYLLNCTKFNLSQANLPPRMSMWESDGVIDAADCGDRSSSISPVEMVPTDAVETDFDPFGTDTEEKFISILKTIVPSFREFDYPHTYDSIKNLDFSFHEYQPSVDSEDEYHNLLLKLYSINKSMQERLLIIFSNIQQNLKKISEHQVAILFNLRIIYPHCL